MDPTLKIFAAVAVVLLALGMLDPLDFIIIALGGIALFQHLDIFSGAPVY